ncbi:DUF3793 family protein [Aminipila luticellarii]|uniref:DUF3793 family protein n=1 Tax=Aminipila luticellarii TaxID=2507160 RepID=A0A410PTE5_9FIRM|nr:DUF3793 family protein [Aminipila luticellarii]QAT42138.1 DUF3793 family protein [Aminipila luticellarii]
MLEKLIIENCAPTLANLKTGEIVNYRFQDPEQAKKEVEWLNKKLDIKGVRIEILAEREKSFLLYVYRRNRLACDLSCPIAKKLLKKQGYLSDDVEASIRQLHRRIGGENSTDEFPHEIGLFLSYPAQDVKGFIENRGKNCKCCGYWKVYEEEENAARTFAKFDKCKAVYKMMCNQGADIHKLTVAC